MTSKKDQPWLNGRECAVMVTFDFDAETMWFSDDPTTLSKPSILSQGGYGPRRGLGKALEVLQDFEVPASFYVPGWTVENHLSAVESILKAGHEIGHHGHLHKYIDPNNPAGEIEEMDRGLAALKSHLGVVPKGYRAPAATSSPQTLQLVQDRGFLYNSGFLDDVFPYRHILADGSKGPIELPFHWNLDDSAITFFSFDLYPAILPNQTILDVWKAEFDALLDWGGLVNITLHPQLIGRPSRITLMRQFLDYMRGFDNVWFATGTEVAEAFAKHETAIEHSGNAL